MTLSNYLQIHSLTATAFAARSGIHRTQISRALRGHASQQTLKRLYEATDGQVTPNDVIIVRDTAEAA